jgi:hypothetical protein
MIIPKRAFDEYGFFDEKLKCTQDYTKWFEMMKTYHFVHMQEVLTKYRLHDLQGTNKNPLVVSEGDSLWIMMMQDLSSETKNKLEGSELNFYVEMALFLKVTLYKKAMKFAEKKVNEMAPNKKWKIKNCLHGIYRNYLNLLKMALIECRANGLRGLFFLAKRYLKRCMDRN